MIPTLRKSSTAPHLWLAVFLLWAATLYLLSSFSPNLPKEGAEIPFLDKIAHFTYFFGGGILLTTLLLLKSGKKHHLILPVIILAIIGALDEFHQTFTPGRTGNDPFDWLADLLGASAGTLLANHFHPHLLKFSFTVTEKSPN